MLVFALWLGLSKLAYHIFIDSSYLLFFVLQRFVYWHYPDLNVGRLFLLIVFLVQ